MSFRRKLFGVFTLAILVSIATVAIVVSVFVRRAFDKSDNEHTADLVSQFQQEFNRRGEEIAEKVNLIASGDTATRIAISFGAGGKDFAPFVGEARTIADTQQLDFLEFADASATIISSAQWPAKFGYKDDSLPLAQLPKDAFLKKEQLPDGEALGLFAIRQTAMVDVPIFVIGGKRLDRNFLAALELPAGMRVLLYQNFGGRFSPQQLIAPSGSLSSPEKISSFVEDALASKKPLSSLVHWSQDPLDDEVLHAIPLNGPDGNVLGILLVGNSRRQYVELQGRIRSATLFAGGAGLLLAVLLSGWAATRVTRPVEQLVHAAREVANGNWNTQVEVDSSGEIGELAESFNRMTRELLEQREHLVRAERIAAWKELARRLAHELKNPLFPLQLTVENLVRARQQQPEQFEEIFRESSATLLAEIANLKAIISRFGEFSRMPQPRFRLVDVNGLVRDVAKLFQAQLQSPGHAAIQCKTELAEELGQVAADSELLHRALSNLVLNALDAMPQGGELTLRTGASKNTVTMEVWDTGKGLTKEECERLFTPYYTNKAQGTGLGLAIVQSIISDHGGTVSVRSEPGHGAAFLIELPRNLDKLQDQLQNSNETGA